MTLASKPTETVKKVSCHIAGSHGSCSLSPVKSPFRVNAHANSMTATPPEQKDSSTHAKEPPSSTPQYHKLIAKDITFDVHARYTDAEFIGTGAYGSVCSVYDNEDGKRVAIKKIFDIQDMDDVDAMRTLREIRILRHLNGHDQVVTLESVFPPPDMPSAKDINEVYLVCGFMPSDLGRTMRSGHLKSALVPKIMYGIMRGIQYIHAAGIMHRDMKPRNILCDDEGNIRIADFGLAIGRTETNPKLINYVVTRWYRAPELLLECKGYDGGVDVWAIGCILGEMLARKPLFRGGNAKEQLKLILSVLGKPNPEDVEFIDKAAYKKLLLNMRDQPVRPWAELLSKADTISLDLLTRMLTFNPRKRITVDQTLAHDLFEPFRKEVPLQPQTTTPVPFVTGGADHNAESVQEVFQMLVDEVNVKVKSTRSSEGASFGENLAPDMARLCL